MPQTILFFQATKCNFTKKKLCTQTVIQLPLHHKNLEARKGVQPLKKNSFCICGAEQNAYS